MADVTLQLAGSAGRGKPALLDGATSVWVNAGAAPASAPVTIDNTAPGATDVQAVNGGSSTVKPDRGDTVTLTYSEPADTCSVVAGWDGSPATNVIAQLADNGVANDALTVWNAANTAQLPLGSVNLGPAIGDHTSGGATFGATGTPSTMTKSGNALIDTEF